jgi:hypothetical protein
MFGRHHHLDSVAGGTAPTRGWSRADRTRRRDRERAAAELIKDLRWQWRSACSVSPLAHMIYTPSGPTRAVPLLGHVDVGPPTVLSVQMRPGQSVADFVAAAPAIAPALGATALEVTPLVPGWVRIVLVTTARVTRPTTRPAVEFQALGRTG